jgi:hypothetical protein
MPMNEDSPQDSPQTQPRAQPQTPSGDKGLVGEVGYGPVGHIIGGWLLAMLGSIIVANSIDTGSAVLGALIGSVGLVIAAIGVIAQGVKLGLRHAGNADR